ncbi:MAG: hypothetical protein ABR581_00175 [Thermoleophilaceae bacterium]
MTLPRRTPPLSQDAALVLALAGTAVPFAHSAEDEAERWLRALRMHGQVGTALQALGVGEGSLVTGSDPREDGHTRGFGAKVVDEITRHAGRFAIARRADTLGTVDVLFAILQVYDRLFDRALYARGTSRDELFERLVVVERSAS